MGQLHRTSINHKPDQSPESNCPTRSSSQADMPARRVTAGLPGSAFCDVFIKTYLPPLFLIIFAGCNQSNNPVCTLDQSLECWAYILVDGEQLAHGKVYSTLEEDFEGRATLLEVDSSVKADHTTWTLTLKMSDDRMLEINFSVPSTHHFHVDQGQEIEYQVNVRSWNGHRSIKIQLIDLDGTPLFTRNQPHIFNPEIRDCKPFKYACGLVSTPQLKLTDGQIISVGDTVQTDTNGVLQDFSLCRSYYLELTEYCNDILEQDMVTISTPAINP